MECSFEGCGRLVHCKRLCAGHYHQHNEGGTLAPLRKFCSKKPRLSVLEKAKAYSIVNPDTGCWEWQRHIKKTGYGQIPYKGYCGYHAHRAVYEELHGWLTPDVFVLHRCDNRRCVNPDHLTAGSGQDNVDDRNAKRRQARGEDQGASKLTWAIVHELRRRHAAGESYKALAREHGVRDCTVRNAVLRLSWKD